MNFRFHFYSILLFVFLISIFNKCQVRNLSSVGTNHSKPAPSLAAATSSHLIFEENFEEPRPFLDAHNLEVGNWDYALQFVTDPVFQGKKSARFEIRNDQPLVKNGKRAEAVIVSGAKGDITKDTWYSFAVYFPSVGFEYDSEREVINQWYQDGSPATSLRTWKDKLILETGNTPDTRKRIDIGPIIKDKWQQYVLHFIHSHEEDGLIEIWQNGKKMLSEKGGNMYDNVLPKWKIGLYKAAFKYGTSLVVKRVIYYDNVKVGNAHATLEEMMPGNNQK